MRRATTALGIALALGAASVLGFRTYESRLPGSLTLVLRATAGGAPVQFDRATYRNPGGAGQVRIRDFRFYLSNVELTGPDGAFRVEDSYHLVRFDSPSGLHTITVHGVPRRCYEALRFGIGVDPEANASIVPVGDLDPNNRMAWNWEVGYKFVLFEGVLMHAGLRRPLVYHVGFDENYRTVTLPIAPVHFDAPEETLRLDVNVMGLFGGADPIDMASLSSVKFDRGDASRIASHFPLLIEAVTLEAGPSLLERMLAF